MSLSVFNGLFKVCRGFFVLFDKLKFSNEFT